MCHIKNFIFFGKIRLLFLVVKLMSRRARISPALQRKAFDLFLFQILETKDAAASSQLLQSTDTKLLANELFTVKTSDQSEFIDILNALNHIVRIRGLTNTSQIKTEGTLSLYKNLNSLTKGSSCQTFLNIFTQKKDNETIAMLNVFLTLNQTSIDLETLTKKTKFSATNVKASLVRWIITLANQIPFTLIKYRVQIIRHNVNVLLNPLRLHSLHHQFNRVSNSIRYHLNRVRNSIHNNLSKNKKN